MQLRINIGRCQDKLKPHSLKTHTSKQKKKKKKKKKSKYGEWYLATF